jgi:GNAT superfamily N-acetyltransferase
MIAGIAGFVTPESRANAYFNIHPDYQSEALERAMLDMAERCLAESDELGRQHLTVWTPSNNHQRASVLLDRGYIKGDWPEHQYERSLDIPIPAPQPADGYTIRSLGDISEVPARSWLSWKVFHPDEPDEKYGGWDWYPSIQRCPLYRRDLDLVAVAPDGELCAFTTVWYDDVTRTGYFEPVGTSPDHQRKGLGKVAGYSEPAKALYASVMTPQFQLLERWERSF